MQPRVTYIMSLGHSGSTFLQYLLATQTNLLGLGEVHQLAKGRGWSDLNPVCSCGEPLTQCKVWQGLKPSEKEDRDIWYRRLVHSLKDNHPQFTHLIDSSKNLEGIQPWLQLQREGLISEVRVLFLIRDARGWVVSNRKNCQRKGRPYRPLVLSLLSWWRAQRRFLNQLNTMHLTYQIVSYEGLVFQTSKATDRISKFLSLNFDNGDWSTKLNDAVIHDVFGNRMKNDLKTRTSIIYDDSWQYCINVNVLAPILIPVWRLNKKLHINGI